MFVFGPTPSRQSRGGKTWNRSWRRPVPKKHAFAATMFAEPDVTDHPSEDDEADGSDHEQQRMARSSVTLA